MFEEKDHERKGVLSTYQGHVLWRGLVTVAGIDLDRLAEMYSAVVSTRVLFFSSLFLLVWKEVTLPSPHSRDRRGCPTSRGQRIHTIGMKTVFSPVLTKQKQ